MMKIISKLVSKDVDVFLLLDEIKRQLNSNWVYLHFDVLKAIEKCSCFEGYENQIQLSGDGRRVKLIKATFKKNQNEKASIYIENCKVGKCTYYSVNLVEIDGKNITPTPNPKDGIFFEK